MNRTMTFSLDPADYDAVQRAMAARQSWRRSDGGPIYPDGESDLAGTVIAEICRGWLEMIDLQRPPR